MAGRVPRAAARRGEAQAEEVLAGIGHAQLEAQAGALAGLHRDLGGGGVPTAQGQAAAAAMQLEAAARIPLAARGAQVQLDPHPLARAAQEAGLRVAEWLAVHGHAQQLPGPGGWQALAGRGGGPAGPGQARDRPGGQGAHQATALEPVDAGGHLAQEEGVGAEDE